MVEASILGKAYPGTEQPLPAIWRGVKGFVD
jgi:hypothetical protein